MAIYGPKVHAWCRSWRLQDADAEDVTQAVLLKLAFKLRDFEYDPARSFRGWLKTIAFREWRDQSDRGNRQSHGTGDSKVIDLLETVEARRTLAECLENAFDQELLAEAIARVQLQVERRTWEAFRLLAEEGWSGAETAAHLGMKVATVFVARSKVQRLLRLELERLENREFQKGTTKVSP
ncbi:sigma-70 family RNA polymerase sigma factor [soil metagenome]